MPTTRADSWRELYRCDDLLRARAVATCIASMEFDVRLEACHRPTRDSRNCVACDDAACDDQFPGPFVIEVPDDHYLDLAEVLAEIIDEQAKFDDQLERRRSHHQRVAVCAVVVAGVVETVLMLLLIDAG